MATLTHSLSLSSHHHNYYHSPSNSLSLPFHATLLFNRTHFNPKHSFVCLASTRKARPSRKLMSDDELCNSLREFVALIGLPEGHVPSTKQLTLHGRKDLANIVRRRGHKLVEELLAYYANPVMDGCDSWENMNGESSGSTGHEEIGQEATVNDSIEESIDMINDDTAVSSTFVMTHEAAISSDDKRPLSIESPVSMQEKVENFMKYGELDAVEDDLCADLKWNDVEESTSSDSGDNFDSVEPEIHGQERASHIPVRSSNAGLNGTLLLRKPSPPTPEARYTRNTHLSTQIQQKDDFDHEKRSELKTTQERKRENEIEIDRLKVMLHQKELELSRLKEEIEKEKQALSIMQTKVEDEISKAQKLISEKEAELLAAEESLSGLVEAKIQYSGEGQMVEVAGSFNGWHQKIKMDPQISSVTIDPIGSRKPRLWATTLWLYPGVYEMKFIIDGHWKIDPQKEITNKRGLENNILRVDR